jgi:Glycosyl transferase family 2
MKKNFWLSKLLWQLLARHPGPEKLNLGNGSSQRDGRVTSVEEAPCNTVCDETLEPGLARARSAPPARKTRRGENPTISLVIPARNEARNLEVILPKLSHIDQLVLVDGHSVDDTIEVAQRIRPDITLVQQTRTGKGNALACGFAAAKGDIIVMFDADGSADPAEIPGFVSALAAGADFAKGTRFGRGGGSDDITTLRRIGNAFLSRVTNLAFRTKFSDLCYGYNAFWRDIVPLLNLPSTSGATTGASMQWGDGFEIETLISCRAAAAGLLITEVPSVEHARIFGKTQLRTFADGARVLRTIFVEWRRSVRAGADRPATDLPMRSGQ